MVSNNLIDYFVTFYWLIYTFIRDCSIHVVILACYPIEHVCYPIDHVCYPIEHVCNPIEQLLKPWGLVLLLPTESDVSSEPVPYESEPVCNRTWDGWLCWDDAKAGYTSEQHCPDYFQDFDPSGKTPVPLGKDPRSLSRMLLTVPVLRKSLI